MSMCELSNILTLLSTVLIRRRLSKYHLCNLTDRAESLDIIDFSFMNHSVI